MAPRLKNKKESGGEGWDKKCNIKGVKSKWNAFNWVKFIHVSH